MSLFWHSDTLVCACGYSVDTHQDFYEGIPAVLQKPITADVIKAANPDFILNKIFKIKSGYSFSANTISIILEQSQSAEISSVNVKGNGLSRRIYPSTVVHIEPIVDHSNYYHDVSIGVMCRCSDYEAITKIIEESKAIISSYIFVIDALSDNSFSLFKSAIDEVSEELSIKLINSKFSGDFSRQRNFIQQSAETEWVLQLDSDELISQDALSLIGQVIHTANKLGVSTVGLPRANNVDGVKSALYPDFQYRLNKHNVRFKNIVHEEPDVFWRSKCITSLLEIQHSLDSERLPGRSKKYESMKEGAGRDLDRALLMTNYNADYAYY